MPYAKCKVYSDGGHFIAIPPTTRPKSPKRYRPEELIEVEDNAQKEQLNTDNCIAKQPFVAQSDTSKELPDNKTIVPKATRKITRKQLFNELYAESAKMKRRERKTFITSKMMPYFNSEKVARQFVEDNFARQLRNLICRKTRLYRKARLQPWSYFCTFTYDSAKHTEESFRKKLSDTFKKMCYRRGWKYIGVWERSVEKERLKALNEVVDSCLSMKEQYTTIFNDLSVMILKDGELELFMRVNALNEVAVIKEMGSTHFLFKTDWKETIWRKKIVKAANRYLDYADIDYLNKTIKYIAKLEFFDFTVDFSSIDIKDECKRVITTNIELCNKFNLDISTMEKTRNPFDNF